MDMLKPFCHFADENGFIEVTEWKNGEGVDVNIASQGTELRQFSLTYGELELLYVLTKMVSIEE